MPVESHRAWKYLVEPTPDQTFYEGPDDIYETARNARKTEPAKFVKDAGQPTSPPVTSH